ncbi:MAG: MFS transporter [Azospirillaceae bacterium]|nr:MFS transporter [Azospirillaceae bacterium]
MPLDPADAVPAASLPDVAPVPAPGREMAPATPDPAQDGPHFRTIALIIASALFMEQLDSTVLATALPTMAQTFQVSPLHMSVALTSYLLSLAVFIPASGTVADRFGARNVFGAAIVLFVAGSILCAQADSLLFLVLSRILQGLGGAMMVPVGRLVLLRTVEKRQLIAAMSWLLVPALIGPVIGPVVGGFIVTNLSWRWIFYINVPIGIIGLIFASIFIPDVREAKPARFDFRGLVLSGTSLACLVFSFEMGSRGVVPLPELSGLISLGLVSGALYVWHARHHQDPILDLTLMRIPTFSLSVIAGSLTRITGGAIPFLLPLMMQIGFGMSAAQSGLVTFTGAVGSILMKASSVSILRWVGFRTAMIWNAVLATGFIAIDAAFRPSWPMWAIYVILLISGFFQSLQFSAYNSIAYADIPAHRMSAATSFYTTFQQVMLSLGICVSAFALQISRMVSGHPHTTLSDFSVAFLVVTGISILAAPVCALLPRDAGADMSGHHAHD